MNKVSDNMLIIIGVVLGLATGATGIDVLYQTANVISQLFMNLLKMIALPVVFLAITSTITSMRNWSEVQDIGRRILKYTLLTTFIAASVALLLFLLIDPVRGAIDNHVVAAVSKPESNYLTFALQIIPPNLIEAFRTNNVIGIAFVAFLMGIATLHLPSENKQFLQSLFSSLFQLLLKITGYVIRLMPIGIWAFMTLLMHDMSGHLENFQPIMLFVTVVITANLIQGLVVLPVLLKLRGISPWQTARGASKALLMAFLTKSSNATLPLSISTVRDNLNVDAKVASTSLPLCSVINMNGCAAFILSTVLFVSMSNGMHFSHFDMFLWIFLASLAAIGNAGVPMGCYFLASAFLVAMNVPLYIMGLILPVYAVIDMIETCLNVWSDISITTIVNKEIQESAVAASEIAAMPDAAEA